MPDNRFARIRRHPAGPFIRPASLYYLLWDDFKTALAAPFASPHTCEPGPGTLTTLDTGNHMSIAGDKLVFDGTVVASNNPRAVGTTNFGKKIGRTAFYKFNASAQGGAYLLGWTNVLAPSNIWGIDLNGTAISALFNGAASVLNIAQTWAASTDYILAIQQLSDGIRVFIKGGAFTEWELIWLDHDGLNANMFAMIGGFTTGTSIGFEYFRVRDMPAPFSDDLGINLVNVAAPVSGVVRTAVADLIADFTFTLSGTPAAGDRYDLRYNILDANNYNVAYVKRNAGNTAYDFLADKVVAGSPTNLVNITGVGSPDRVRVIHKGNNHDFFTYTTITPTKRGGTITDSNQAASTGISANWTVGTPGALVAYAKKSNSYLGLNYH